MTTGPPGVHDAVTAALNGVLDPCSIGRGVPTGLVDMGLVLGLTTTPSSSARGRNDVALTLRTTGPGCTFVLHFEQQVRARLAEVAAVGSVEIEWAADFDWSDDDLHPDVSRRLRERRDAHRVPRPMVPQD